MSLKEQLRSESSADRALEAIFDLTHAERQTYKAILEVDGPVTVAEIATEMKCASTSAYRYVDTLERKGLFRQVNENYEDTGRSAYVANSPEFVADRMEQEIEEMFEKCSTSIEECRAAFEAQANPP
ncbi:helix-turn-helix domain-containing protein [Halorhabdus sp. CBA1104]|uniref:helix-turn-helix domain-containing protein n=1 Tax=Halorhabdus sp. CBA1104 TaxID=1380432 RepID=UPI0018A6C7B7|nr:helix-turn-helix domain-containing protein [Halorhabdus sp. CBA1104]